MNEIWTQGVPSECRIVNVVSTYYIRCRLNLRKLALENRDRFAVKFNPARFAAATINLENEDGEGTTALAFASGNIVHTGAKTEEASRLHAHTFVRFLNEKLGIPAMVTNFTITNMVCDYKLGFEVCLADIKSELGSRAKYTPIKFPACRILSTDGSKKVSLVYKSGGTVLTGLKAREEIRQQHRDTYAICRRHRFIPKGSVSNAEMRMECARAVNTDMKLNLLNKKLQKMQAYHSKRFNNELQSVIKKTTRDVVTSRVSRKDGIMYLGSLDPLSSKDIVPFNPTAK